jgi:hypothetical protein
MGQSIPDLHLAPQPLCLMSTLSASFRRKTVYLVQFDQIRAVLLSNNFHGHILDDEFAAQ